MEIESGFRKIVTKVLSIINDKPEQRNNDKTNLSHIIMFDLLKVQIEDEADLFLFAKDRIALYGQRSKISAINYLLTQTTKPTYKGKITLNDIDILEIPRKSTILLN